MLKRARNMQKHNKNTRATPYGHGMVYVAKYNMHAKLNVRASSKEDARASAVA